MDPFATAAITTAITVVVTLTVTLIFNRVTNAPKKLKEQKEAQQARVSTIEATLADIGERMATVETSISHFPDHEAQLQEADASIVELCKEIRDDVVANRQILNDRLTSLERREKNALRAKILDEYRLFTDEVKNPSAAWAEMEHHSFFQLVEDYESLGGNDYVHSVVIPAMNELDVIPMSDLDALKDMYNKRKGFKN